MAAEVIDRWLPKNLSLTTNVTIKDILFATQNCQLYNADTAIVLVYTEILHDEWRTAGATILNSAQVFLYRNKKLYFIISCSDSQLCHINDCEIPRTVSDIQHFVRALKNTRKVFPLANLFDSIYHEAKDIFLPLGEMDKQEKDDAILLGKYISGGVEISCSFSERLSKLSPTLTSDEIEQAAQMIGVVNSAQSVVETKQLQPFRLHGRKDLEKFFTEEIIDIVLNLPRYERLGVHFPSAFILTGKPGCGKTFAVDRLVEYLGWPSFSVSSGSIGSKYIHETSFKIASVFKDAIAVAPAIVIIDEMEAFLSSRNGEHSHQVEEVAEFLRVIPEAIAAKVLIIGMTNKIEWIDEAILRRGRFDKIINIEMPSKEEMFDVLECSFAVRPCGDIDISSLANALAGKPLSDATFIVNEAARLAARAAKECIEQMDVDQALKLLLARSNDNKLRHVGFRRDDE